MNIGTLNASRVSKTFLRVGKIVKIVWHNVKNVSRNMPRGNFIASRGGKMHEIFSRYSIIATLQLSPCK